MADITEQELAWLRAVEMRARHVVMNADSLTIGRRKYKPGCYNVHETYIDALHAILKSRPTQEQAVEG